MPAEVNVAYIVRKGEVEKWLGRPVQRLLRCKVTMDTQISGVSILPKSSAGLLIIWSLLPIILFSLMLSLDR